MIELSDLLAARRQTVENKMGELLKVLKPGNQVYLRNKPLHVEAGWYKILHLHNAEFYRGRIDTCVYVQFTGARRYYTDIPIVKENLDEDYEYCIDEVMDGTCMGIIWKRKHEKD